MSGDVERDAEFFTDEERFPPHLRRPPAKVLSFNQVVAFNMWRARKSSGWSQQEVAELLEKYTGRPWSNASVSAAERSWQGGRPRRFDANEIVALSRIFDEPIGYFFLPDETGNYYAESVGMQEFPDGVPNEDPEDRDSDLMSLVPVADVVQSVGYYQATPPFIFRMSEIGLSRLGLTWEPPTWKMPFKHAPRPILDEEDVDWGEVQEHAEQVRADNAQFVERVLTAEQQDAFLRAKADDLALKIAEKMSEMGLLRDIDPRKAADWTAKNEEEPPF